MSHSRGLGPAARCSKGCTRTPTLACWYSRCCVDGVVLGWCSKKLSPRLDGWCSKSWGGAPKSCPRILDGVVFQKLGWCSKQLSQNPRWGGVPKVGVVFQKVVPESSMGWCSKSWGGVPKNCPRIPTLYTTHFEHVYF